MVVVVVVWGVVVVGELRSHRHCRRRSHLQRFSNYFCTKKYDYECVAEILSQPRCSTGRHNSSFLRFD
jgi:hypothetical protein